MHLGDEGLYLKESSDTDRVRKKITTERVIVFFVIRSLQQESCRSKIQARGLREHVGLFYS
jgi:hypothetical protein